jgi:hypothetical protein
MTVTGDLARCQLEAERPFPAPSNKGGKNWADRAANLQKRAENVEACMRAAGYRVTAECSAPLKTYESCMKIGDDIMRGPSANQYRDADWNRICLDNEWDVRTQKRLLALPSSSPQNRTQEQTLTVADWLCMIRLH